MKQSKQAAAVFEAVYKGETNLMTPEVIGYYQAGDLYIELSFGRGFSGETIYGVTHIRAVEKQDTELAFLPLTGINFCTDDREQAEAHILELQAA